MGRKRSQKGEDEKPLSVLVVTVVASFEIRRLPNPPIFRETIIKMCVYVINQDT